MTKKNLPTAQDENYKSLLQELKSILNTGLHKAYKAVDNIKNTSPEEIEKTLQRNLVAPKTSEVFKNTYNFKFAELTAGSKEKDLETLLVNNIEKFLKELGEDFSFSGRQVPIKIDNQTHYIDLVVYHRAIPCNILIDLKNGKVNSQDIGQMNKYIAYYKKYRQYPHERNTIGLIIGKEAGREEIEFALEDLEKKIFVATYQTKLPSNEKIKKAVRELL